MTLNYSPKPLLNWSNPMLTKILPLCLLLLALTSCSSHNYYSDPCRDEVFRIEKKSKNLAKDSEKFKAQGDYEGAIKAISQSLSLVESLPYCPGVTFTGHAVLANNYLVLGMMRWDHAKQYEEARQDFAKAYYYASEASPRNKELLSTTLHTLLYAHAALGELEKAEKELPALRTLSPELAQQLEEQIKVLRQAPDKPDQASTEAQNSAEAAKLVEQGNIFYNQKNYTKAMERWSAAANLGSAAARYNAGMLYEFGMGVSKDEGQAVQWYLLASQQGVVEAQAKVGAAYMLGAGGLAKNSQEGLKWLSAAAGNGSYDGQYLLGAYYLGSFGDSADMNQAVKWLVKAGMQNNAQPVDDLGPLLFKGMIPQARYPEVVAMLQKWADADHTAAQIYLARMQETGLGTPASKVKAHSWYSLALDIIQPDPQPWGDDLATALSVGRLPSHTALSRSIAALEKTMTAQELAQSKKMTDTFRAAHSNSGK
jgi:TPR repeat protein